MRKLFPNSVRSKLVFLGFLASLPVVLLMVFNFWYQRRTAIEEATERMKKVLHLATMHEEEVIGEAHRLLATLAEVPEVRKGGREANDFLARILKNSPDFTNFGIMRPDGKVVISAVPLKTALNFADQPYFQDLLKKKSFTVGQYVTGRITGKPIIPFGYPLIDRQGRVTAVIFAPLDLSRVTEFDAEITFQTFNDSHVLNLDSNGAVLSSYPPSQQFGAGHSVDRALFGKILNEKNGTFQTMGADGVRRLYLFSPFMGQFSGGRGYVLLGIPTKTLFAGPDRLLITNLAVLSGVGVIFLAIMWFGGSALILRPVGLLTDASKRMAKGDLTARSDLPSSEGELGQLGRAFDEMAEKIERGQKESLRMQEVLRTAKVDAENEKAKTEAVIAGIGDAISIHGRDYTVLYQNQASMKMGGNHTGEPCYRAFHNRDRVCDGCASERSFRDGQIHTAESSLEVDGRTIYLENTASPLRDASGTIVASIEVVRDITERKQAEHRIRKGMNVLSALREIDRDILRGAKVHETLDRVCDAVVGMGYRYCWVGLAESDYTVRPVAARGVGLEVLASADIRWDDSSRGQGPSGTVIKTGMPLVTRDIHGDEEREIWEQASANPGSCARASYPLKSGGGSVWGVFHAYGGDGASFRPEELLDLETFAGQAAVAVESSWQWETIRDAHQRLSFHVNRMPLGYIVWDKDFRVVEWNPAAERIFGWTPEEAAGKTPYELIVPSSEKEHVEKVWKKLMLGAEDSYSLNANVRKDGKVITCEWFNTPLRDAQGDISGILTMVHDVTEKTQLERQLQTAQRLEAVGTLAGGIAHDFNNALTGILGFADMLKLRVGENEKALSDIAEIIRCGERAATLTRQLLTYSRRQIISPINLGLNNVVTDLMKLVSKVVGEHIEIRTFLAEDLPVVRADAGQMEQVVMNLVLNARDAMPSGGQLLIETGMVNLDGEYIRYHPYMHIGRYAVLTVSDTGSGMDTKTQERVFEPFFTTKAQDKGTGLGLAVVYGIVKQHNGFIHLYSEPGKGTTFKIYIPPVDAVSDVLLTDRPNEMPGGTETILLAEDDESVRRLSEQTLKNLGYTVIAACNGEEALTVFDQHQERIDLALLDVVMPVKGGKEAYEGMHKMKPGLKVIFMSGYTANAVHESFILMAGVPFLPKPFGPAALARKVREVLDNR